MNTTTTIDITPTWASNMEILLMLLEKGTDQGKDEARAELRRVAKLLDQQNAQKEAKADAK